jgi:hypothetical protein
MRPRKRFPYGPAIRYVNATRLPATPEQVDDTGGVRWADLRDMIEGKLAAFPEARQALTDQLAEELGLKPTTRIET